MKKSFFVKLFAVGAILCLFLSACGNSAEKEITEQPAENTKASTAELSEETKSKENSADAGTDESVTELTEEKITTEAVTDAETSEAGILKKVNVYADEVGIYSVIIELNENAADKAVIEMVYTGATGTAEEGSVVNTYRIEYYRDSTGKYEISTFFNGNIDVNYHQKDSVKVENTFGAATRAADVAITYTPEGGEAEEIFRGFAKDYR